MFYRENGQFKTSYRKDQQIFAIAQDRWAILALIAFAFIGVPFIADEYMFRAILIPFLILSLAALGVNILVGYCGQISLGSGAFMAVGAYMAYNTYIRIEGMPLIVALLAGGFFCHLGGGIFWYSQFARQRLVSGGGHLGRSVLLRLGFPARRLVHQQQRLGLGVGFQPECVWPAD